MTLSRLARWLIAMIVVAWLFPSAPVPKAWADGAAQDVAGSFTIPGKQGAIVLKLVRDGQKVSGSLKGGTLSLVLKGFARAGEAGYLGTANTDAGAFASYFAVRRENNKILFDLIEANADGDPDLNKKNTITFPTTAPRTATPTEDPDGDEPDDADMEDGGDDEGDGDGPVSTAAKDNEDGEVPQGEPRGGAPSPGRSFAGTYSGDGLQFTSRAQGADYVGTLALNGQKYSWTGTGVNGVLHGAFTAGNEHFDFRAQWQGNQLVLVSGDSTYKLQAKGGASNPLSKPAATKNPLSKPAPKSAAKPVARPAAKPVTKPVAKLVVKYAGAPAGGAGWKSYKHALGLIFRYPPTWSVKTADDALLLVPPDVKQVDGGPTELFLVSAQPASGITRATDPQFEQAIEAQAAQLLPGFTRVGQTKTIQAGPQVSVLMTYEGEVQGTPARAQVWGSILKSYAVGLVTISAKNQVKASRDDVVRRIFTSMATGASARDPKIVGRWYLYSYKGSGSYGRETQSYLTLLADGTALWGSTSEAGGNFSGTNSQGQTTWTGGVSNQGSSSDRGTWAASNGSLFVAWGDGSTAQWDYRVGTSTSGNRRLFLTGANNKVDEWMER